MKSYSRDECAIKKQQRWRTGAEDTSLKLRSERGGRVGQVGVWVGTGRVFSGKSSMG